MISWHFASPKTAQSFSFHFCNCAHSLSSFSPSQLPSLHSCVFFSSLVRPCTGSYPCSFTPSFALPPHCVVPSFLGDPRTKASRTPPHSLPCLRGLLSGQSAQGYCPSAVTFGGKCDPAPHFPAPHFPLLPCAKNWRARRYLYSICGTPALEKAPPH